MWNQIRLLRSTLFVKEASKTFLQRILLWRFTGLPVGFYWLWYSVLCTVESLSLLYLLLVSLFLEMMH